MSLYLFDATSLTTTADRRRRPALSRGQLLRTLLLFMLCVVALAFATRQSRAAEGGFDRSLVCRGDHRAVSSRHTRSTMSRGEDLTITLPADLAAEGETAVATGGYRSTSEVVGVARRDWSARRSQGSRDRLKADIAVGLADVTAGRAGDFDVHRLAARGRDLLRKSSSYG